MTIEKDGGPAFPAWELNGHGHQEMTCFGMSLRDYFAANVMSEMRWTSNSDQIKTCAYLCYSIADAMLEARKK